MLRARAVMHSMSTSMETVKPGSVASYMACMTNYRTLAGGRDPCTRQPTVSSPIGDRCEGFIAARRRNGRPLPGIPPGLRRRSHGECQGNGESGVNFGVEHGILLFTCNVWVRLRTDPRASYALTCDFVEGAAAVTRKCACAAQFRRKRKTSGLHGGSEQKHEVRARTACGCGRVGHGPTSLMVCTRCARAF